MDHALLAADQQSLRVRVEHAHERALGRDSGHHRREGFADPVLQCHRRDALAHRPLHLACRIFFQRAILSDGVELGILIGRFALERFQQPLRHQKYGTNVDVDEPVEVFRLRFSDAADVPDAAGGGSPGFGSRLVVS